MKVQVQDLCREYSGKKALDSVSFEVEHGEIFAMIGPNGAGKTTLLRILDLLDEPSRGTVWFDKAEVNYHQKDRQILRRKIGIVFQQTVLFNMSVHDNVAYSLRVRDVNEESISQKVRDTLDLVQLQAFERLRKRVVPFAKARGYITDAHVFRSVS